VTVVGGAATGCQLASIFRDFGAEVDLLEASDRLNPQGDADVSNALAAAFVRRGMHVLPGARLESLERRDRRIRATYRRGKERELLDTYAVFFAVGWPTSTACHSMRWGWRPAAVS
jgi:pyruvate/2-oxoglutarate dehydrogenase complex dihydrolipoamide dehydrogenase (E3) component